MSADALSEYHERFTTPIAKLTDQADDRLQVYVDRSTITVLVEDQTMLGLADADHAMTTLNVKQARDLRAALDDAIFRAQRWSADQQRCADRGEHIATQRHAPNECPTA